MKKPENSTKSWDLQSYLRMRYIGRWSIKASEMDASLRWHDRAKSFVITNLAAYRVFPEILSRVWADGIDGEVLRLGIEDYGGHKL